MRLQGIYNHSIFGHRVDVYKIYSEDLFTLIELKGYNPNEVDGYDGNILEGLQNKKVNPNDLYWVDEGDYKYLTCDLESQMRFLRKR